jgi:hypothetical protein
VAVKTIERPGSFAVAISVPIQKGEQPPTRHDLACGCLHDHRQAMVQTGGLPAKQDAKCQEHDDAMAARISRRFIRRYPLGFGWPAGSFGDCQHHLDPAVCGAARFSKVGCTGGEVAHSFGLHLCGRDIELIHQGAAH